MRRTDRLFRVIQMLRRARGPLTAARIATELEVSPRTVYRDIAVLIAERVPISGEAGFGYVLDDAFDLPPLMLTPDEIEAAVLGAQWVTSQGDAALAAAARDLVAKITSVVPAGLRIYATAPSIAAPPRRSAPPETRIDLARTRSWIHQGRKIRIAYRDERDELTERVIWPIVLGFFDETRMLAAWCELREDFRHFRADRIEAATFLDDGHGRRPGELRQRWKRERLERDNGGKPLRSEVRVSAERLPEPSAPVVSTVPIPAGRRPHAPRSRRGAI